MNVFEFHERYKIAPTKARWIAKENPQWFDGTSNATDLAREAMAKGNPLSVAQLVQLIDEPRLLLELGKYADKAESQVEALGKPENQVAPKPVSAAVFEAARNDPEQVEIIVDWLKHVIPARPVGHAYLATRLLLGIPASIRKYEAPRIPRALLNCRNHPELAGWWHVETRKSRRETVYQKKAFDL